MRTLTTLPRLLHLAPMDLTGIKGTSVSSNKEKEKFTLSLNYQANWAQIEGFSTQLRDFYLCKSLYKVLPPWIKYLKLHLVNSIFTRLNGNRKGSSPVTLTVALI